MLLIYDSLYDNVYLTKTTCKAALGNKLKDLLSLTGIYSIFKFKQLPSNCIYVSGEYPNLILSVETETVTLTTRINVKTKKLILVSLKTNPNQKGIGAEIFYSQIYSAYKAGLELITCQALRSSIHNGYITWGKLGFTMEKLYLDKYFKLLNDNGIANMDLFTILFSDPDFWERQGFTWGGIFELKAGSTNKGLLEQYLRRKISINKQNQKNFNELLLICMVFNLPDGKKRDYRRGLYFEKRQEDLLWSRLNLLLEV